MVDDHDAADALAVFARELRLDPLAVADSIGDSDQPKVDDFGHHLLVVVHDLRDDRVETYEVDCFLTADHLLTVHSDASPSIEALWRRVQQSKEITQGGPDELLARLADVCTRRLLTVVDAYDDSVEELTTKALTAHPDLLGDLTALRRDLARVRRAVLPQREMLDLLRRTESELVSNAGRRRFSDVFDVAERVAHGLDAARSALSETLEAYRGAEAKHATEVSKVLTVYAAVVLPLSLVAGFFGMNHTNLPTVDSRWGWLAVLIAMVVIAVVSLGMFVALGWIRPPSGRRAGAALGKGLIEAAKTPVQLVEAVYEVSVMPVRETASWLRHHPGQAHDRRPGDPPIDPPR